MAAREEKIIMRITPEMKTEFQQIAESMGMTMSSLGAFVIGNYIKQEKQQKLVQTKMLEQMIPMMLEMSDGVNLNDPRLLKTVSSTFGALMEAKMNET